MSVIPDGSAIITPNEMYKEMQGIAKNVDRLATILDPSLAQLRADVVEIRTAAAAQESRVRALENWRWFVLGVAALVSPVAGLVLARLYGGA